MHMNMLYDILDFFFRAFLIIFLAIITFMVIFALAWLFPFILIGVCVYTIYDFISNKH